MIEAEVMQDDDFKEKPLTFYSNFTLLESRAKSRSSH
jgi:hypothetical protein